MNESVGLLLRGAYAGAALLGTTVVVLGGARPALILVFFALGVLVQWMGEAWGVMATTPLVALSVIFTAGGPVALAALAIVGTTAFGVAHWIRGRRAHLGQRASS